MHLAVEELSKSDASTTAAAEYLLLKDLVVRDSWLALSQCPSLVEHNSLDFVSPLQRIAPLDKNPA